MIASASEFDELVNSHYLLVEQHRARLTANILRFGNAAHDRVGFLFDPSNENYAWLLELEPGRQESFERAARRHANKDLFAMLTASRRRCPDWVVDQAWRRFCHLPNLFPLVVDLDGARTVIGFEVYHRGDTMNEGPS